MELISKTLTERVTIFLKEQVTYLVDIENVKEHIEGQLKEYLR